MSIHPFLIPRIVDVCIGDVDLPIVEAGRKMPPSYPPTAICDEDTRLVTHICHRIPVTPAEFESWRERDRNYKATSHTALIAPRSC
jgi:hypothetical protein